MGMLMYEDMKVSVLQLLLVRKRFHYERWGVLLSSFPHTYITNIKGAVQGQGKLTVRGEKWCSRRLREEE